MTTKMFTFNGKRMVTWNPFVGCNFQCSYCWARQLAQTRLKGSYPFGFIPTTRPDRFSKRFKPNDFVFVCDMGDIAFAPSIVAQVILDHVDKYPETKFLLCTKDPNIFRQVKFNQANLYLGTTIESNRDYKVSRAPSVRNRTLVMRSLTHAHKFLSIEPIMDFDIDTFLAWIAQIKPEIIEIGADNYKHNLHEPSATKIQSFIEEAKDICPTVILKAGIERLTSNAQ